MAVEELKYQVERKDGAYELRIYRDVSLVQFQGEDGFDLLFQYIQGHNVDKKKIAMTAPVINRYDFKGGATMSFVLPKDSGQPLPTSRYLQLEHMAEAKFVVVRFAGNTNKRQVEKEYQTLLSWVKQEGYRVEDAVYVSRFNSPFMPPMFRHNELMLRVIE
ncbi:MAG: SOUL family heme-binding protein [Erysipelotrichaceae bacterium]